MLEYEFSDLDNDFITLWSKYIVTKDLSLIVNDLQKLARLGQINAVQSWYLFKQKGDDKVIDSIVSGYTGGSYNELFAIGNYNSTISQNKDKHNELMDDLRYLADRQGVEDYEFEEKARDVIKNSPCIYPYYQAKEDALYQAKTLGDYTIFERANEMLLTYAKYVPLVSWQNKTIKEVVSNCKVIRKKLLKQYNACLKNNPKFSVNDNPQLCYALAKSIVFLADTIPTSKKEKELGVFLIKQLSEREYKQIRSKTTFTGNSKMQSILDIAESKSPAQQDIDAIFNKALQSTNDSDLQL